MMSESDTEEKPKVFRPRKSINRKTKLQLIFDEKGRREFLTGFHKRKLQRKKKAQEELAQQLKEERKRLKQEARESYKKLVVSHRPIPELENIISQNYDLENHSVSINELSACDLAEKNNWIGSNKVQYEEEKSEESHSEEELPGMELKTKKDIKRIIKKEATKKVKKSKVFEMKNKLERQKNKKDSLKKRNKRIKIQSKSKKKKKKHNNKRK